MDTLLEDLAMYFLYVKEDMDSCDFDTLCLRLQEAKVLGLSNPSFFRASGQVEKALGRDFPLRARQ